VTPQAMDSIIKKLQELEREARALQEKEKEQVYSQLQTTPAGNVNDRQEVSSGWPSGSFNQEFPCTPVPLCPTRSKVNILWLALLMSDT